MGLLSAFSASVPQYRYWILREGGFLLLLPEGGLLLLQEGGFLLLFFHSLGPLNTFFFFFVNPY